MLAFVAIAIGILVWAGDAGVLGYFVGFLLFLLVFIWFTIQLGRARQLGRSLRVGSDTLPELQAILDGVRWELGYDRPVEVYVSKSEGLSIATTNYLGTRIIVLEGGLVGDLLGTGKPEQLTYLLGREIGALKARLTRLDVFVVLLSAVNAFRIVTPFLTPYYRATTYSGDQIGMVCAGDLDASLEATRRLMVGDRLAPSLGAGVVVPQARLVRERFLPRFAQLFIAEPHLTNRYANLLCFGRFYDPDGWERLARGLSDDERASFELLWARSPYARLAPAATHEPAPPTGRPETLVSAPVPQLSLDALPPPAADDPSPPLSLDALPPPTSTTPAAKEVTP